jgi:hypothetical protein
MRAPFQDQRSCWLGAGAGIARSSFCGLVACCYGLASGAGLAGSLGCGYAFCAVRAQRAQPIRRPEKGEHRALHGDTLRAFGVRGQGASPGCRARCNELSLLVRKNREGASFLQEVRVGKGLGQHQVAEEHDVIDQELPFLSDCQARGRR